jgi:hypothetical protein
MLLIIRQALERGFRAESHAFHGALVLEQKGVGLLVRALQVDPNFTALGFINAEN